LGLHYAHELKGYDGKPLGVVHRDFTPQNIMVTYDGDVKIVDFGIAKALDQQGQTAAGMFKGKLTYVPPEQLMGQPVDRRADVFAAGVMLFEAVTGTSPWDGLNNAAITHALASGRIPRLLEVDTAHPELAAICDQAMAVHPDDRFSTADEMRIALEDYVREHGLRTDRAQLGEYAQTRLADVRKRTHEIIDQQLKHQGALPRADTLAQNLPTLDGVTPPPVAKVLGRSVPELMSSEAMPDTGRERQSELERPSSRTPLVMALAGLVMVLLGVVTWLVLRPAAPAAVVAPKVAVVETPPPVVPPPAPVPTPAPAPVVVQAPTTPPPPERVTVRVSASPPNARVFVDDLEMPSNPFVGEFPRDSAVHELRVTATGHVEVRRAVQFEREVAIDIALAQVPQVIRVPVRAPPPAPAPVQPRVEPPPTVSAPPAPQPATDDAYFGPAPTKPKTDDATYFGPAKKKQPKPALDTNIEFK
jgi:serine/threonine-protein kinase